MENIDATSPLDNEITDKTIHGEEWMDQVTDAGGGSEERHPAGGGGAGRA